MNKNHRYHTVSLGFRSRLQEVQTELKILLVHVEYLHKPLVNYEGFQVSGYHVWFFHDLGLTLNIQVISPSDDWWS